MNLKEDYNLSLYDIQMHRDIPFVQNEVQNIMDSENLKFGDNLPLNEQQRILEIWCETIVKFKQYQ